LKKLSTALDAAQKASRITTREVARAKRTVQQVEKDTRLLDTSAIHTPERRARKRRSRKKR
jgi:hypothetical protein